MRRDTGSLLLLIALFSLGCGPTWMFPGGRLSGEVQPAPTDWSFTDAHQTIQLETRPEAPYSVNVWGVGVGDHFYIAAGRSSNAWAAHIAADPNVRVRIGGAVYELRGTREDTPEKLQEVLAALQRKYDFEPDEDQQRDATLFRFEAR